MESLEPVGLEVFLADLEAALGGKLTHTLANSTSRASSVLWPEALAGQALFEFRALPRTGGVGKLLDGMWPKSERLLAPPLREALGLHPEWAS
jgi:hypothetical protein